MMALAFAFSARFTASRSNNAFICVKLIHLSTKHGMPQVFRLQKELQGIDMNAEITAFCGEGELKEALSVLRFMENNRMPVKSYAYDSLLHACTRAKRMTEGKELYSHMKTCGLDQNLILANKLVTMFVACESPVDARLVFDNIENRDIILWNAMISGYVSRGIYEEALKLYCRMQNEGFKPDYFTFPSVLKACAGLLDLDQGKEIHDSIVRCELDSDIFVGNALVDMYAKCGDLDFARQVFDKMPERSVVTWNAMVAGCVQNGRFDEAFRFFYEMQLQGIVPNPTTVVNLLTACANGVALRNGREIHGFVKKWGFDLDSVLGNALIDMYAKCGRIEDAVQVFDKMSQRDVVSWNSMAAGFLQNGLCVDALTLFTKMQKTSVQPNSFTFVSILPACGRLRALQQGREVHSRIIKSGLESHVFVGGALVDMYSKCKSIEDAEHVFYTISQRDVVSWNAMIVGYVQNAESEEAFKLFHQMDQRGPKPNSVTIASVLPAFARLTALRQGKELHDYIIRRGFETHVAVGNALIDMYAKCGRVDSARHVFEKISEKTVVSWNAIIAGYGIHGHVDETFTLFTEMRKAGFKPDHITFIAILSACSHCGLVDKGWYYFNCMIGDYDIIPRMEHYTCMVDLLGRVGELDVANDFINKMPFEPDSSIWGTLLGACRIHSNVELAEKAAEHLFQLEPENTGFYVLLSNIYAVAGRWCDVAKVRKMLRNRGLRKEPGCSWIEFGNNSHAV